MEHYYVTGMSCDACRVRVEKAVRKLDGVSSVSVSLLTNSMVVEGNASSDEIIRTVQKAGYGASIHGTNKDKRSKSENSDNSDYLKDTETPKLIRRLVFSLAFLLPLMYITMGHNMFSWPVPSFFDDNHVALGIVQMLLSLIILFINQKFFVSGFKSVFHFSPNMDTLVALGSSVSFVWSVFVLFKMTALSGGGTGNEEFMDLYHNQLYFESAAMIPALITLGKMLESLSKGKTTDALKSLIEITPKTAVILNGDEETTVPVEEVDSGDIFIVKPGANVPVDGIVLEGTSAVDESSLTGESIPVDKSEGDVVCAGTINSSGFLKCRATRVGGDTTLSQIVRLVSDSASTKAPIGRIADKVSGIFVPAVILIAVIVLIVWLLAGRDIGFALARAISVLVISCPCALGLATPVAIMVGNGVGAKHGILFKTSEALENAGRVKTIALDKTGTITNGNPVVTDIVPFASFSSDELLSIAVSLEKKSEHPLAKAILAYASENGIEAFETEEFSALPGNGLIAEMNGRIIRCGSLKFISRFIDIPDSFYQTVDSLSNDGKTPLFFEKDGVLAGIIAVADSIKDDSSKAISEMKKLGIKTVMLTGDNEKTARAVGKLAGVDKVFSELLPNEKERIIKDLQINGKVAMVGDGINDAPSLVSADIGIALGAGTDVAIDCADVVLVNDSLVDAVEAIRLSKATLKNIHENLFWAFFYNLICIPLAAGLFSIKMNPMICAAAMSFSSVTVCLNALRLNLFKPLKHNQLNSLISSDNKTIKINSMLISENETNDQSFIYVDGMMCEHCETAVKEALEKLPFVVKADADYKKGVVTLFTDGEIDEFKIKKTVEQEGYCYSGKV